MAGCEEFSSGLWGEDWWESRDPLRGDVALVRAFFVDKGRVASAPPRTLRGGPHVVLRLGRSWLHLSSRCSVPFNVCPKQDALVVSPYCWDV